MNENTQDNLKNLAVAGIGGGAIAYEYLPTKYKYNTQTREVKPLSKGEKILLVHSDPFFGSGHFVQAKALEKELRNKGYNNILLKEIQEIHPNYKNKGVNKVLYNLYKQKRKLGDKIDNKTFSEWVRSYYHNQLHSTKTLADDIKNFDRVLFFTGDVSESVSRFRSPLRKALLDKKAPYTHLIYTDRGIEPSNIWWNTVGPQSDIATISRFDSVFIPDKKSFKEHKHDYKYKDQINPKYVRGLSVDVDTVKVPKKDLKPKYFIHGGSTGVNVIETAENLLRALKENKAKGNALIVFGAANPEQYKVKKLKREILKHNIANLFGPKIHYVDSLDKPTMNYYLKTAPINFTAGGTSYEELGRLGKPSLFTFTNKNKNYSHPKTIMGLDYLDYEKHLPKYISNVVELEKIPNTELGIGRLTGSDIIDSSDYNNFKTRLEKFESQLPTKIETAKKNAPFFGYGAVDIVNELEKGDKSTKVINRKIPRFVTYPLAVGSSLYLTNSLLKRKKEKEKKLKNYLLLGGAGLGTALIVARPPIKKVVEAIKKTKHVPNLTKSGLRNLRAIVDSLFFHKRSKVGKIYKQKGV